MSITQERIIQCDGNAKDIFQSLLVSVVMIRMGRMKKMKRAAWHIKMCVISSEAWKKGQENMSHRRLRAVMYPRNVMIIVDRKGERWER